MFSTELWCYSCLMAILVATWLQVTLATPTGCDTFAQRPPDPHATLRSSCVTVSWCLLLPLHSMQAMNCSTGQRTLIVRGHRKNCAKQVSDFFRKFVKVKHFWQIKMSLTSHYNSKITKSQKYQNQFNCKCVELRRSVVIFVMYLLPNSRTFWFTYFIHLFKSHLENNVK